MAEYIDKHEAYTLLKDLEAAYIYPPVREAYGTAARRIDQIKPADVQPVKRGRWIMHSDYSDMIRCTHCNSAYDVYFCERDDMKYCPYCGARMDLGDEKT